MPRPTRSTPGCARSTTCARRTNRPITFSDFIRLNHYTLRVDYDTSIEALKQIYAELENAPGAHAKDAPRILIMGRGVAAGDYVVPSIIESAGGSIVCEFLDECIRPFHNDISTEGDVVEAMRRPSTTTRCRSASSSPPGRPASSTSRSSSRSTASTAC